MVDGQMLSVFQNSPDRLRTFGGELEARYAYKSGAWWSAAASYTRLETDDPALEVNSGAAVASLRGFLPLQGERLGLAAELVYNSPRKLRPDPDTMKQGTGPSALIGRFFLSGHLRSAGLVYRAGVTNVLDWDWSVPVGEEFVQQQISQEPRIFHLELIYEVD